MTELDETWRGQQLCIGKLHLFFARKHAEEAIAICNVCPVKAECEADLLATMDLPPANTFGVRAGKTYREWRGGPAFEDMRTYNAIPGPVWLAERIAEGLTGPQMADLAGCSLGGLRGALKRHGLSTKKKPLRDDKDGGTVHPPTERKEP